jgi:hypothetical protein
LQRLVIDHVSAKAPVTTANVKTLTELRIYSRSLASPLGLAAWSGRLVSHPEKPGPCVTDSFDLCPQKDTADLM